MLTDLYLSETDEFGASTSSALHAPCLTFPIQFQVPGSCGSFVPAGTSHRMQYKSLVKPSKQVAGWLRKEEHLRDAYLECEKHIRTCSKGELAERYVHEYNSMRGAKQRAKKGLIVFEKPLRDIRVWLAHLGPRPAPCWTVDRIDFREGYLIDNLRWATKLKQTQNRSVTKWHTLPNGKRGTVAHLADYLGLPYSTVYKRIRAGWSMDRIVAKAPRGVARWEWPQRYRSFKPDYDARPRSKRFVEPLEWLIGHFKKIASSCAASDQETYKIFLAIEELEEEREQLRFDEIDRDRGRVLMVLAAISSSQTSGVNLATLNSIDGPMLDEVLKRL